MGRGFFMGCISFFLILFMILVVALVFSASKGVENSFLVQLGINVSDIKTLLSQLVFFSFGTIITVIFVLFVIFLFGFFLTKKSEPELRKRRLTRSVIALVLFVVILVAWIYVYLVLSSIPTYKPQTGLVSAIETFTYDENNTVVPLTDTKLLTAPITIQFSAKRIADAAEENKNIKIVNYDWDLDGDGEFLEKKNSEVVIWEYTDKGDKGGVFDVILNVTYQVVLPYKDYEVGQNITETFTPENNGVGVSIAQVKPTVVMEPEDETITDEIPFTIKFDATESFDPDSDLPVDFEWDLNEDQKIESKLPTFEYDFDKIGTFDLALKVVDDEKNYTIVRKKILALEPTIVKPSVTITASPMKGEAPLKVTLDGGESSSPKGKITKYEWDLGDGSLSKEDKMVIHTYQTPGKYIVTLKITDEDGNQGTGSMEITAVGANTPPEAIVSSDPKSEYDRRTKEEVIKGSVPLTVEFDAVRSKDKENDIVSYAWDFDNDGTVDETGKKVSYTFRESGTYVVSLVVEDSAGNKDSANVSIEAELLPLEAILDVSPKSGSVPLKVRLDGSGSRYIDGKIVKYKWDFGDGSEPQLRDAIIEYTYDEVGEYLVRLSIFTDDNQEATTSTKLFVSHIPVVAKFIPSVKKGKVPLSVEFDPSGSSGAIVKYTWEFGDGGTSEEIRPTHNFTKPGTYEVTLRVVDNFKVESSFTETIEVVE